jgi:succinyl-diaminopimelate desuccinylase
VLREAGAWLAAQALEPHYLTNQAGETVGLHVRCRAPEPGPVVCLDACIDTAPFGDEGRWLGPPTSGRVADGKLMGRGAADSKTGVAILAHVVRDLVRTGAIRRGGVDLLFDADEHTGRFGGVRAWLAAIDRKPDGAVLGYPGNDELIRGSRGFHRVRLVVAGRAGHSGATDQEGVNAIAKLARLVAALEETPLPAEPAGPFAFGPKLTVTEIAGGEGFSQVPDRAQCSLDIRLTPGFGAEAAARWLDTIVARCDAHDASPHPTRIEPVESWPSYLVAEADPLVRAFQAAGCQAYGRDVPLAVCAPRISATFWRGTASRPSAGLASPPRTCTAPMSACCCRACLPPIAAISRARDASSAVDVCCDPKLAPRRTACRSATPGTSPPGRTRSSRAASMRARSSISRWRSTAQPIAGWWRWRTAAATASRRCRSAGSRAMTCAACTTG